MMSDWEEPLPLIECVNNELRLNDETANLIREISKPMVVVTIAGPYRTGKSYLMNRLAGKNAGFSLGATVESHTKGIWVWKLKHPLDDNKVLLLMDTEGLGDPKKGDLDYDTWICCMAILLSSMFVYNIMGSIGTGTIDQLSFTLEMSKHIRTKSLTSSDVQMDEFFPTFVLAIRDFYLQLKTDRDVTPDEYLEDILTMKHANSDAGRKHNDIRKKIRSYFKQRKCFCFIRPTAEEKDLHRLETISDEILRPAFLQMSQQFCQHVFENAPVKRIDYSQNVKGETFIQLADIYLNAIRDGVVPCIETALSAIKKRENEKALTESVLHYEENFRSLAAFPISTDLLTAIHENCYQCAIELFAEKMFLDEGEEYHARLQDCLNEKYVELANENKTVSFEKCKETLNTLFAMINYNVESGVYIIPGGYKTYVEDVQDVELRYFVTEDLGPMVEETWLRTLNEHELQRKAVLQADLSLTELEQEAKADEARRVEIEREAELSRQQIEEIKLHEKTLMKAHEAHVQNLHNLYAQRQEENEAEFQKTMAQRTKELERLMQEKFDKDVEDYRRQLNELKGDHRSTVSRIFGSALGIGGSVLSIIPHPVVRGLGFGLSFASGIINHFRN